MAPPLKAALAVSLLVIAGLVVGRHPPPVTQEERPPDTPDPTSTALVDPPVRARASDPRQAVARVFGDAVAVDPREPRFLAGDFNGDGAEDVAVVVSPSPDRLPELNHRLSNWTVQDARRQPPGTHPADSPFVRVEEGDQLLAVVHGQGPAGWRSPEARQAYLIRNAVEPGMRVVRAEAASAAAGGDVPRLRGDVFTYPDKRGLDFVYWTGARYARSKSPSSSTSAAASSHGH